MMMMEWNWFQKLKRSKKIPQRSPESMSAKWGKRPFIRCIPFEATIDNVQLHFSQFGHALDLYLPMVKVVDLHLGRLLSHFVRISPEEPGRRSRLWVCEDVLRILKNNISFSFVNYLLVILNELKLIDLSDSQNLIEIPDFSGVPNLKHLILRRCTRLYKICASLGDLKQLIQLDLNGCKCLKNLPHKINLEALEIIDLGGCSRLKKFLEITGNMSRLSELRLSEIFIKDLSLLLENLTSLTKLDLKECKNLSSLPNAICSLMSLKTLNLSGCSRLDKLPDNLGNVEGLEVLNVSETGIRGLRSTIILLKSKIYLLVDAIFYYLNHPISSSVFPYCKEVQMLWAC
ncbi:hypothetical protein SO802_024885 [Lithocarpus litseifolius]|uniref:Disease resistance protein RPS4B/Roq1-like leucine-rich repeats domain-containing protein n=1 Tax=Lithocarpus litseifolius TaxID=425828 RepID=A0AAW2CCF4_9ROSI